MEIPYNGRYAWEDFRDFNKLHMKSNPWILMRLILIVFFLLFIVSIGVFLENYWLVFIGFVALASLMPIRYLRAKQAWSGAQLNATETSGTITEQGVTFSNQYGKGEGYWSLFTKYACNHKIVILFQGRSCHIYPRAFFASHADWNAFVELVKSKVPAR